MGFLWLAPVMFGICKILGSLISTTNNIITNQEYPTAVYISVKGIECATWKKQWHKYTTKLHIFVESKKRHLKFCYQVVSWSLGPFCAEPLPAILSMCHKLKQPNVIFQQDVVPSHWSFDVRQLLDEQFPDWKIGRGGSISLEVISEKAFI